jgi:hypothetical protein
MNPENSSSSRKRGPGLPVLKYSIFDMPWFQSAFEVHDAFVVKGVTLLRSWLQSDVRSDIFQRDHLFNERSQGFSFPG